MVNISGELKNEIIKSFAYGMTAEEISDAYEIDLISVKEFEADHAFDITQKAESLKKEGWA